jgi:transposase-like protein
MKEEGLTIITCPVCGSDKKKKHKGIADYNGCLADYECENCGTWFNGD